MNFIPKNNGISKNRLSLRGFQVTIFRGNHNSNIGHRGSMYHGRFSGSHYEMGVKRGLILKKCGARFPIELDSFQSEFGKQSGTVLRQIFPEAYEEVRGITDTLSENCEIFLAWLMCMGCCLNPQKTDNTEIRGCTGFAVKTQERVLVGRNNDLPLFLKPYCKSELYAPKGGNRFLFNTSSFVNGEEGINEHGLVAAMFFVMPKMDEIKPGLNSVFLVRYILEKCRDTQDALAVLRRLPIASNCNMLFADKSGNIAVAECNPANIEVRHGETNATNEIFVISTNHFESETMRAHAAIENTALFYTQEREQAARKALSESGEKNADFAMDTLRCKSLCFHPEKDFDTVWSSVFDITAEKIWRAEGNPSRAKFAEDKRFIPARVQATLETQSCRPSPF